MAVQLYAAYGSETLALKEQGGISGLGLFFKKKQLVLKQGLFFQIKQLNTEVWTTPTS